MGICMGYENFTVWASEQGVSALEKFEYYHVSLPLEFTVDPRHTLLYGGLGEQAFYLEDHDITYNSHTWGVSPETFATDPKLKEMFTVTAVSYMPEPDNRAFVASVEGKKYPILGT
mmetsp:Transcript_21295/g.20438  ORF Transcript_21295/g.20438 Transcript_21295/m.20438 type:complete len:116 (+) Transcript_21295:94-441(+)